MRVPHWELNKLFIYYYLDIISWRVKTKKQADLSPKFEGHFFTIGRSKCKSIIFWQFWGLRNLHVSFWAACVKFAIFRICLLSAREVQVATDSGLPLRNSRALISTLTLVWVLRDSREIMKLASFTLIYSGKLLSNVLKWPSKVNCDAVWQEFLNNRVFWINFQKKSNNFYLKSNEI